MAGSNIITTPCSATGVIRNGQGTYYGFSLYETTAAATATIIVYDNASAASGTILETIKLASGESAREFYAPQGLRAMNGIYVSLVSGTINGSIRHG